MDSTLWLIVLVILILIVVAFFFMRRGGASSAAKQITDSANKAATSATNTVKDTASSAANATKSAATDATNLTKGAASSATGVAKDAASGAGDAMSGALGALTGASGKLDMGQMTDMLGGIMNGNLNLDANSPLGQMITPMADGITSKLGLPKEVGAMVVAFALAKIAEMLKAKSGGQGSAPMSGGTNADQVLGKINSGGGIDAGSLQSMGLTSELANKTGLSETQASQGLEMAMGALSAGISGKKDFNGMTLPDMSMLTGMMK
jgi:hypothetical protein